MKNFKKFALSFTQQRNTFGQGRDEYSSYEERDRRERDSEESYDEREARERDEETTRRDVNGGDSGTPPSDDE